MNTWFWSDGHFGHGKIIEYCDRPFTDAAEMDEALIQNWNSVVKRSDFVYVLGDVFFCQADRALDIMTRLNGQKYLIYGNHDKPIRKNYALQGKFDLILGDYHEVKLDDTRIIMCHYPILSWNGRYHGSFMLHGHCHGNAAKDNVGVRRLDVGVDDWDYTPVAWEVIKSRLAAVDPWGQKEY